MTKTSRASLFASLEVGKPLKNKEALFFSGHYSTVQEDRAIYCSDELNKRKTFSFKGGTPSLGMVRMLSIKIVISEKKKELVHCLCWGTPVP